MTAAAKVAVRFAEPDFRLRDLYSLLWLGPEDLHSAFKAFACDSSLPSNFLFTSSCRAALMLAYRALRLQGEVIVSPLTCKAALLPILAAGLRPRFADVCPYSFNLCPESAKAVVDSRTVAIQAIYLGGNASGATALAALAAARHLKLVEDCAHGAGARDGREVTGAFGDVACLCFPKIVDGIGGALCCRDSRLIQDVPDVRNEWPRTSTFRVGWRLLRGLLGGAGVHLSEQAAPKFLRTIIQERRRSQSQRASTMLVRLDKCSTPRRIEFAWAARQLGKWRRLAASRQTAALQLSRSLAHHTPSVQTQVSVGSAGNLYTRFYARVPALATDIIQLMRRQGIELIHLSHGSGACQVRLDQDPLFHTSQDWAALPNYFQLHDHVVGLPLHPALGPRGAEKIAVALKASLAEVGAKHQSAYTSAPLTCLDCRRPSNE